MPNLMFEHLAVLEILTVNAQKWGHVTLTMPLFANFFQGRDNVGIYLGSCVPNYKCASLPILELLPFNAEKK